MKFSVRFPCGCAAVILSSVAGLAGCESTEMVGAARAFFPPSGVDHLEMTVTVDVELPGLGRDEALELEGTVAVHRSGPMGDGRTMVGDMVGAALRGRSKAFGEVVAGQSPIQHSPCEYVYEGPRAYRGHFDINAWFFLPEHDLLIFSGKPVRVRGVARGIPPVGQVSETVEEEVALYSFRQPSGPPIGVMRSAIGAVGELVDLESHLKTPGQTVPELLETN